MPALDSAGEAISIESLTPVSEQSLHEALGLTNSEYARIVELLEREPNHFELAVFSLLWSEHCGYKHSARLLKRLPSAGERVLQGPGENAGSGECPLGEVRSTSWFRRIDGSVERSVRSLSVGY